MPRAQRNKRQDLSREERRERRILRREKQQKDNIGRAAKMHVARLQLERARSREVRSEFKSNRIWVVICARNEAVVGMVQQIEDYAKLADTVASRSDRTKTS